MRDPSTLSDEDLSDEMTRIIQNGEMSANLDYYKSLVSEYKVRDGLQRKRDGASKSKQN